MSLIPSRFFYRSAAWWRFVALTVIAASVCVGHYGWWSPARLSVPTDLGGESWEMLARIKAASEGDLAPFGPQVMSRLGAPFGANWSAYPSSDLLLLWSLGQVARVTGVAEAANLALLLAGLSAAWSFYACARWLRVRWEWAMAGALLFAFTYQTFTRGLPHLLLAFSWSVPLTLLSAAWVATSRRLTWRSPVGAVVLGTAVAIGLSSPYLLFMYLQLMGWAMIVQLANGRQRGENLKIGGAALGLALTAVLVVQLHTWLFVTDTAADSPLERNYGGTERYALKPLEFAVPPATHRWEPMGFFGQRYLRWSDWRSTEAFNPYLGAVGLAGLVALGATAFVAVLRRRRVPGAALAVGWVLAFASVGGLTNFFAFFSGMALFRASNRFSVFVSAAVLLFLVTIIARWWWGRSRKWSVASAAALVAFGLADQLPRSATAAARERVARTAENDRDFGRRLEAALPDGAMVFQLPVVSFPEAPPQFQLGDSEHFRPMLVTETLRFSYGALKGRSRGQWQRDLARLTTAEMIRALERYGFAAIYLNRRGLADRGEEVLSELKAMGRTERIEGARREQIVVLLKPAERPEPPLARTLTVGRGWHRLPYGAAASGNAVEPRWAYENATMSFFNPYPESRGFDLKLSLSGAGSKRSFQLLVNGREELDVDLSQTAQEYRVSIQLRPGANRFDLESPEPAVRLSQERRQLRVFAVHGTLIRLADSGDAVAK